MAASSWLSLLDLGGSFSDLTPTTIYVGTFNVRVTLFDVGIDGGVLEGGRIFRSNIFHSRVFG